MSRTITRSFSRAERVGGHVHKVLADLIQKGVNDPRLERATVTGVSMSRDLRIAKVYVAAHGGVRNESALLAGLASAKGFIKRQLARELGLRYMPELKFFYDASVDYGAHIDQVLKALRDNDQEHNPTIREK